MSQIDFTRISNDTNGNPRYVCHYTDLLTEQDKSETSLLQSPVLRVIDTLETRYKIALKRAKQLGGRKFHNKQYGGGIVFQSYNIARLEKQIKELITGTV